MDPRLDELRERAFLEEAAGTLRVTPFYGAVGGPQPGLWMLSQWASLPFTDAAGDRYPTAEHFMMAAKARLFGDDRTLARVLASSAPADAKRLGRQVSGFSEARWRESRFELVVAGNRLKFRAHPGASAFLASTRGTLLVEASPTDLVWGVGLPAESPAVSRPSQWRGQNLLGFALTVVRDEGEGAVRRGT